MKKKHFKAIIKSLFSLVFLYLVIVTTLPYLKPQKVSTEFVQQMEDKKKDVAQRPVNIDRVRLVETTADAFNARYELITSSKTSLDLAYHIIQDGRSTNVLFAEIYKAAEREVTVRFLIDGKVGLFNVGANRKLRALAAHPNIQVKGYNPLHLLRPKSAHALLHDKFIIADGTFLLLGGRNMGDQYFAPNNFSGTVSDDRDVFVWNTEEITENSVLSEAMDYMDSLWNHEYSQPFVAKENQSLIHEMGEATNAFIQENPKHFANTLQDYQEQTQAANYVSLSYNPINVGPKEPRLAYELCTIAKQTENQIFIQTPYSTANKKLLRVLEVLNSKTDVTLLTNSMGSSPNLPAFSNYYFQREKFIATGTKIYEYQQTDSIHGKSMVFDGQISAVGSFNLDDRSFYLSTESMLVIDSPEFADTLTHAMQDYIDSSLEVGTDNEYMVSTTVDEVSTSWPKKILMGLMSLLSRPLQFLI